MPTTRPDGKNVNPSEVVGAFYRVLMQEDPPTLEQEKALFRNSAIRTQLIAKTGVPNTQPVLLELFRKHRDLFLPKNMEHKNNVGSVTISSPWGFVGRPGNWHSPNGCYVTVIFVDDKAARPARQRSVVFEIDKQGKLEGDWIYLGGFDGEMTYEKFFDVKWALEHADPHELDKY